MVPRASQVVLVVKNLPANAGDIRDMGSTPGLGRSPGEGHGNPLQYSCLGNPMERGAWWAIVHEVAQSWTRLMWLSTHAQRWFPSLWYDLVIFSSLLVSGLTKCYRLILKISCLRPGVSHFSKDSWFLPRNTVLGGCILLIASGSLILSRPSSVDREYTRTH